MTHPTDTRIPWYARQHSALIRTRYFSGGFEFETAQEARQYLSDQHAKTSLADIRMTPFEGSVSSNGVTAHFYHSDYCGMDICTNTYRVPAGGTLRDRVHVASPSDCVWMIPGQHGKES